MRFLVLSAEEEQRIHEAALCILEEVGLDVALPSLVAKLREHGFPTPAADRVLIPRAKVGEALEGAPRRVHLGARAADKQVVLDGTRCFTTTGGCGSKTLDMDTDEVRPASLADVPGQVLGVKQWGEIAFRVADLARDVSLLTKARHVAGELLHGDPDLAFSEHQPLKEALLRKWGEKLALGSIG